MKHQETSKRCVQLAATILALAIGASTNLASANIDRCCTSVVRWTSNQVFMGVTALSFAPGSSGELAFRTLLQPGPCSATMQR